MQISASSGRFCQDASTHLACPDRYNVSANRIKREAPILYKETGKRECQGLLLPFPFFNVRTSSKKKEKGRALSIPTVSLPLQLTKLLRNVKSLNATSPGCCMRDRAQLLLFSVPSFAALKKKPTRHPKELTGP